MPALISEVGGRIQFSYWGARGPYNWGRLSSKFDKCSNGKSQSPIDIVKHKAVINKKLKPLIRDYKSAINVTLLNYGFTIGVRHISREQVEALKAPLYTGCKKNSRPVQPMNGRHVELYKKLH
ncbi:alpha carbonic anhydrase 1 [Forsythia ovata]|uniref:Alpha carbonic anhydrase 1 n=1 Tax=Forsythia ovata TaxID=205694 RepID=A0ABD1T8Z1_9LAMI